VAAAKVEKDGTFGFDRWDDLVDPARVGAELLTKLPEAHEQLGLLFVREATRAITVDKPFAPNAPATKIIKGSDVPLQDRGRLIGSLGYNVKGAKSVRLGVSSPKDKRGRFIYEHVHEGWEVSDPETLAKMRRALFAKMRKKMSKTKWRALQSTLKGQPAQTTWKSPGRPFLTHVFEDPVFLSRMNRIYDKMLWSIFEKAELRGG
jgi:hypothetical protein